MCVSPRASERRVRRDESGESEGIWCSCEERFDQFNESIDRYVVISVDIVPVVSNKSTHDTLGPDHLRMWCGVIGSISNLSAFTALLRAVHFWSDHTNCVYGSRADTPLEPVHWLWWHGSVERGLWLGLAPLESKVTAGQRETSTPCCEAVAGIACHHDFAWHSVARSRMSRAHGKPWRPHRLKRW